MSPRVQVDITKREKVFINPENGNRITKLKRGVEIPNSSPYQTGQDRGSKTESSGEGEKGEEKKNEDVPVDTIQVPMTAKEHEEYVLWKAKKDA